MAEGDRTGRVTDTMERAWRFVGHLRRVNLEHPGSCEVILQDFLELAGEAAQTGDWGAVNQRLEEAGR